MKGEAPAVSVWSINPADHFTGSFSKVSYLRNHGFCIMKSRAESCLFRSSSSVIYSNWCLRGRSGGKTMGVWMVFMCCSSSTIGCFRRFSKPTREKIVANAGCSWKYTSQTGISWVDITQLKITSGHRGRGHIPRSPHVWDSRLSCKGCRGACK